jgi:hypothetical protein
MRTTRRVWLQAAGLLLAASPARAQDMPPRTYRPTRADVLGDVETLPQPRPAVTQPAPAVVPASPGCGQDCAAQPAASSWQRWRAEKHAACQAHIWGYPAEFEAPPLGATIHAHFRTMVANGEAAGMVLCRYDFVDATDALNLHGRDRLTKIAAMLQANGCPIVIERTPEAPGLAEARRAAIMNILAMNNIPVPPERVLIGPPIAAGLAGVEAHQLYIYSLRNLAVQAAPVPIPTGGAGIGTTGTGGGLGLGALSGR